jgi:SAM-dependent methyltransferase
MINPSAFQAALELNAAKYEVCPDVHGEDFIFQFLVNNPSFPSKESAIAYYFADADRSSKKFDELVSKFLKTDFRPISVLEFASGYGCVTRHLKKCDNYRVFPCDIHGQAIDFIKRHLDMDALRSTRVPEEFRPEIKFDVVFALSFFSHMPHSTWGRWMAALSAALRPGGIIIFTTHGRQSIKYFGKVDFDEKGYWFRTGSEQKDLDIAEYGQTIVTPRYVFNEVETRARLKPLFYQEAFWWDHQDTYIFGQAS